MPSLLEWVGYAASLIVLISLLMTSVKRLRWINLFGSLIFAVYGIAIGAIPVGAMNAGIVLINAYFIYQMYTKKDYFTLIQMNHETEYFNHFMSFYKENMKSFMIVEDNLDNPNYVKIFTLRNTVPAGLFVCKIIDSSTLEILVDYVTPAYRDFKIGRFLFEDQKEFFKNQGYNKLTSKPGNEKHQSYLKKMGFTEQSIKNETVFVKSL
jgi:GNAT superfamily N-acetyltransferase